MVHVRGKITKVERRLNSKNGNPRWKLGVDEGAYALALLTEPDSAAGHRISEDLVGQTVTLVLNDDQRVIDIVED